MGGSIRAERRRSERAPLRTQSRRTADIRLDVARMDSAFRDEPDCDARVVGGVRRPDDRAGLYRRLRIVRARTRTRNRIRPHHRRHRINRRTRRDCLRRKPRHHQVLARGADVSDAARRDSRAARDIPPHAAHRRSRELRAGRSSDRNCDSDQLRCRWPSPLSRACGCCMSSRARDGDSRTRPRAAHGRSRPRSPSVD